MKTNADEPINFVQLPKIVNEQGIVIEYDNFFGLTKREHFAGLAMQGLFANPFPGEIPQLAEMAVQCADALITALNETKK